MMKNAHILLVEDNEGDIVLTKEALAEANIKNKVSVSRDGEEAINYLTKAFENVEELLPDLILLDINLPRVDGKEVLHFIKTTPGLKKIPVVMLTTSSNQSDIADAYNNYANCFISKPVDFNKFFDVVRMIEDFWISIVKLPSKN
ncbi:response regulator [Segetibacter koreensis]|uniref:response regulator n=1 Tax=Segetibacter koreensis TaxID=398037 RepID=UPI00037D07C4|nr:response regulator [Segetibacter koreensis]